jgi:protein-S-isoprenylcysteine O-methyltransferase Ste14
MRQGFFPLRRTGNLNLEIKRLNRLRLSGSLLAGPLLIAITLLTGAPRVPERMLLALGTVCIVGGIGLRLWALGCIDGNKKSRLVTWGPYRYLRHPLYSGSFLLVLGFCLHAGSLTAAAVAGLVFAALYAPAVRAEERLLANQYGTEWETYRQNSGAFFPRPGSRSGAISMPFRLRRPVRDLLHLVILTCCAFGASVMVRYVRAAYPVPDWFF